MSAYKAVTNALLIDGTGNAPVEPAVVLVRDDRIQAAGRQGQIEIPPNAEVIDAGGGAVMPGIIEGHAHIDGDYNGQRMLRLSLQWGITTVCSVSGNITGIALRNAIEERQVRGCARLLAGCIVSCTNGHVSFRTADGPWEVRKAVREMVKAGADFIKTAASGGFCGKHESCSSPNYTLEELQALTDEAHAWGVPVVVHCHTQPGLGNCISAEVDQIHHGAFIDEDGVRGIKDKNLFYMPTLAVTSDRNIEALHDQPWQSVEMRQAQPVHRAGVRLAHELGVTLCVGCDYPGGRWWKIGERTMVELGELVACGLSPMDAIVAATRNNALAYRKLDDLGTLEPGKKADLLVIEGDPIENIGILATGEHVSLVMKDGIVESTNNAFVHHYHVRDPQPPGRA